MSAAPEIALQLQGSESWTLSELEDLCEQFHGDKGRFAYRAVRWAMDVVYDGDRLPVPLTQWALTAYGRCIGLTASTPELAPVVTLHPTIWDGPRDPNKPPAPCGPRYTLDVVVHELMHVHVAYVCGAWRGGHSSHDNPVWCREIMRVSPKLGLPVFFAAPTVRRKVDCSDGVTRSKRLTPDGSIHMAGIAQWPHSLRAPGFYSSTEVPFTW